ncbi:hypothetical protein TRFO_08050 [Tritrichomonas foetus]|uniref:Uncharacterized protein n=1 Tax=Tritrichomonas foetus TaxID=1144522 RepID=A0A1J4JRE1_9EUKA|nr:hypothetical protein TRFO_08050 [Tritrichomonas foetus]|eukprot:OHT00094.1 hypothetical protein TRFO_08050 [Tritrichomonas foetus]
MDPPRIASKAGLARYRPLQAGIDKSDSKKSNLPNGWFYNEQQEEGFWKNLEDDATKNIQPFNFEEENQHREVMNEMNDSSSRIKALIGKFDYLDQEAMIEMLHTMGDGNDFEDGEEIANTPSAFLEDAKNSVFQYVNEIKELSDSQASLLENLKSWFKNLSNNETFLQNETQGNSESFDKTNVFEFISEYIQETEERMEIAQNIHSDVTHFWMEQMGKYKKSVIQKEIEIKQLKKSLEIAAGKSKKGNKKDKSEKNDKNDNNDKNETDLQKNLKTQLRKVEEQKNTIDKLKNQLHDVQGQLAFIQARSTPSSENFQLRIAERDN